MTEDKAMSVTTCVKRHLISERIKEIVDTSLEAHAS